MAVNGFSAVLTASVVLIFAVAKFTQGAWVVVVVGPLMYIGLLRLHRQYEAEDDELEVGALAATEAPIMRRHVVIVLVDRLDLAAARAIQYARTLTPDDLRAVHFDIDSKAAHQLEQDWGRLGLARLPLDIIECPDRRLGRAAVELVADAVADGDTECTVLLPRRGFASGWQRFLHDRTADRIAAVVSQVPHVSATIVPYNLSRLWSQRKRQRAGEPPVDAVLDDVAVGVAPPPRPGAGRSGRGRPASEADLALARRATGTIPIGSARFRERVRVAGRVRSVRVQPRGGTSNLECVLSDDSGRLLLVFQGRPRIPGHRAGGPDGRLGHGRVLGAQPRHLESRLRAGGRRPRDPHRDPRLLASLPPRRRSDYRRPRPVPPGSVPRAVGRSARPGRPRPRTVSAPCGRARDTEANGRERDAWQP